MVLVLLALSVVGVGTGCRNDCQQLCDRMADRFDACGIPYTDSELDQCRDAYRDATDAQKEQCAAQTEEVIIANLRLKSGTNDECDVLQEYGE